MSKFRSITEVPLEVEGVRFGAVLPTFCGGERSIEPPSLDELSEYANSAERLGFESLWVVEHVLTAHPRYKCSWLEPLTVLSFIASRTREARIGTSILLAPLRNPILLAKTVATLDFLSGGRFILGVGAGWMREEFDALNVPFSRRGAILDEQLTILKKLLSGEVTSHRGRHYDFSNVVIDPKPVQKPHPPIWIGGGIASSIDRGVERVLRRIAMIGDGWLVRPTNDVEAIARSWTLIQKYAAEAGRDASRMTFAQMNFVYLTRGDGSKVHQAFSPIVNMPVERIKNEYLVGDAERIENSIRRLRDIGLNYFIVWTVGLDYDTLEFVGKEVMPLLQKR